MISDFLKDKELTDSELETAILLIRTGKCSQDIAKIQGKAHGTIKTRSAAIYEKTGYKGRAELQAEYIKYIGG